MRTYNQVWVTQSMSHKQVGSKYWSTEVPLCPPSSTPKRRVGQDGTIASVAVGNLRYDTSCTKCDQPIFTLFSLVPQHIQAPELRDAVGGERTRHLAGEPRTTREGAAEPGTGIL